MFPAPVAATTMPSAPAATAASSSEPSIATVAVIRWTRSAARAVATRRRGRLAAGTARPRRRRPGRASRRSGCANVSSAEACILITSSAGSIGPGQADHDARRRASSGRRDPDRVAQVGRPVEAGLVRGAHRAGHDDRLRPVEDEIPAERASPRSCRCPGRRPRRRSTGRPAPRGRPRRSRAAPGT